MARTFLDVASVQPRKDSGTKSVSHRYCLLRPVLIGSPGFVNAQYRFVMNPNGDYTVHFADPDM